MLRVPIHWGRLIGLGQSVGSPSSKLPVVRVNHRLAGACVVVIADTLVIDLRINAARDGRQTHIDFFSPLPFDGWEPMIIKMSSAAEKSAKRRMGWPSDGRYGGCVIGVPQNLRNKDVHAMGQNVRSQP